MLVTEDTTIKIAMIIQDTTAGMNGSIQDTTTIVLTIADTIEATIQGMIEAAMILTHEGLVKQDDWETSLITRGIVATAADMRMNATLRTDVTTTPLTRRQ